MSVQRPILAKWKQLLLEGEEKETDKKVQIDLLLLKRGREAWIELWVKARNWKWLLATRFGFRQLHTFWAQQMGLKSHIEVGSTWVGMMYRRQEQLNIYGRIDVGEKLSRGAYISRIRLFGPRCTIDTKRRIETFPTKLLFSMSSDSGRRAQLPSNHQVMD